MRRIKSNHLLVASSVLIITLCIPVAFAKAQNEKNVSGAEHKSTVSTFVQKLLNAADREQNGIGEQVKAVAKAQEEVKDKVADSIDKIRTRNSIKTFLIGTDYKNVGQLRSEMVKTRNQLDQLNRSLDKATAENKVAIQGEIQTLEKEQKKIEDFVKINESKFSLFGWFVKLFNK